MKITLVLGWLFLCSSFSSASHAIYIGTIKIYHQEEKGHTTMEVKVFSDDLQNALKNEQELAYLPNKSAMCNNDTDALQQYFDKYLQVWVNDKAMHFQLIDCEVINEVHLLHFAPTSTTQWQVLKVKATFFMELFPTQSNVLQVSFDKKNSSDSSSRFGRMTLGKETLELKF